MYLPRTEPDANLARFYRLEFAPDLFGDGGLVREWGQIGRGGRVQTDWFDTESNSKDARFELRMVKAKRGYG